MQYASQNQRWFSSAESACQIWATGGSPGYNVCSAARVWIAPQAATVTLSANGPITATNGCNQSGSVALQIRKNGTAIWPASGWQIINHGDAFTFPAGVTATVAPGDTLQFVLANNGDGTTCDSTTWDPVVTMPGSGGLHQTTTYNYDSYGRTTSTTTSSDDTGSPGSPSMVITRTVYLWNDAVTATATSATGTYLIAFPAYTYTVSATGATGTSGQRANCSYTSYDGLDFESGPQSNFTGAAEVTRADTYTSLTPTTCGYQASLGFSATQGQNQWRYQYSTDGESTIHDMTYDTTNGRWAGPEAFCLIWSNGQSPDGTFFISPQCDSIRTWVAPSAGTVSLSADGPLTVEAPCGNTDGVKIRMLKNGTQL
jgi:hypothetical protein